MQISLYPTIYNLDERGEDARARARPGEGDAAAGAQHHITPTDIQTHMGRQASNGWFSPPQERTSSFERASATNDTRNSLPAAHQQPFVWKTKTTPEPAPFAQRPQIAMEMKRMKKVKRRDALVAALWHKWPHGGDVAKLSTLLVASHHFPTCCKFSPAPAPS